MLPPHTQPAAPWFQRRSPRRSADPYSLLPTPYSPVPIVTVIGLQFGVLLAGAIVTKTIFSWPGLGRLTVSAISNRDCALVQGCLLSIGLTDGLVNLPRSCFITF